MRPHIEQSSDKNAASRADGLKHQLRKQANANRRSQPDKGSLSRAIVDSCLALTEVKQARTILFYVDVRDEVRTRQALPNALASSSRIAVPWCSDTGELELFHLESMGELATGMFGILEPSPELRQLQQKRVDVSELDAVIVPGVAFDRRGGRLGHGRAYYDRLLKNARGDCALIGLAWECQVLPEIPMSKHDIFMDFVVTERTIYRCAGKTEASS